jgi:hypothetical protein
MVDTTEVIVGVDWTKEKCKRPSFVTNHIMLAPAWAPEATTPKLPELHGENASRSDGVQRDSLATRLQALVQGLPRWPTLVPPTE